MVLAGIDTCPRGGQHQEPFYSRHNNQVHLPFDHLATIEGLVVLSSPSRGVNAWEDHSSSPSIVAIDYSSIMFIMFVKSYCFVPNNWALNYNIF